MEQLQKEKATPAPDFEQFNPLANTQNQKDKGEVDGSATKQDDEESKQDS